MVLLPVLCLGCHQADAVYRHSKATDGIQRYRCTSSRRTFQWQYRHKVQAAGKRDRITEMALNGRGIRDTARVLGISPKRS